MAFSNGIITAPISIADVQQVLGDASNDLATLCTSSKINKWSKVKPMSIQKLFDITSSDRASANYGITIPSTITGISDLVNNSHLWLYTKPMGGATSPFRLQDFDGYYNTAVPPLDFVFPNEIKTNQTTINDNYEFAPILTFERGVLNWNNYCMTFGEVFSLPSYKELYPSLVFYTPSTGIYSIITTEYNVEELSNNGGVYAVPFVIKIKNTHFATYSAGTQIKVIPCLQYNKYVDITTSFNSPYYVSMEFNPSSIKTYSLVVDKTTISPEAPVATYNLSFSYSRTTSGEGYLYTINSVTITNTNNTSGMFNLTATIAGQYVTTKTATIKSNVSVSAGGTITITTFDDKYFYTTSTNCLGALSVILSTGVTKSLILPGSTSGTIS